MRLPRALLVAISLVAFSPSALAHIELDTPTARYSGTVNQKVGPCGDGTPTGAVTDWVVGEEVTVTWQETINHTGHYRIALDPTGTDNFNDPNPVSSTDVVGNTIAFVPDESTVEPNTVSHTFIVPDYDCDPCTLQVLQYMAGAASPFYYWCADVRITSAGSSSTTTSASSGATAGAGGGGLGGGSSAGGDEGSGASASNSPQYPSFGEQESGCSIGSSSGSHRFGGAVLLLAAAGALGLRRRR